MRRWRSIIESHLRNSVSERREDQDDGRKREHDCGDCEHPGSLRDAVRCELLRAQPLRGQKNLERLAGTPNDVRASDAPEYSTNCLEVLVARFG